MKMYIDGVLTPWPKRVEIYLDPEDGGRAEVDGIVIALCTPGDLVIRPNAYDVMAYDPADPNVWLSYGKSQGTHSLVISAVAGGRYVFGTPPSVEAGDASLASSGL